MGLSEKSGSPFCVLKKVERIAKNRVGGAKTVPKNKNSNEFSYPLEIIYSNFFFICFK